MIEQAREEALTALNSYANALRSNADTVETKYLERLLADRDEMLAYAHFNLCMTVIDLSARTGIWWTEIYDAVDAVKARKIAEVRPRWLTDALAEHGCAEHPVAAPEETTDGENE